MFEVTWPIPWPKRGIIETCNQMPRRITGIRRTQRFRMLNKKATTKPRGLLLAFIVLIFD
jgi:hypothetical protein